MNIFKSKLQDQLYWVGLGFVAVSLLFFCFPFFTDNKENLNQMFFVNFILLVGFLIVLLVSGRLREGRDGIYPLFLLLVLGLISDYSLNREINIFEETVPWFSMVLVVVCINTCLLHFFDCMPRWAQHIMVALLAVGSLAFAYLAIYLVPYYILGLVASPVIGLSLHVFFPLLLLIYTIKLMRRLYRLHKPFLRTYAGVVTSVVCILVVLLIQWFGIVRTINEAYRKSDVESSNGIPAWVSVARRVSHSWVTERVLKTDLVYTSVEAGHAFDNVFWRMPSRRFWESAKHDPLIVMATLFGGRIHLAEQDRVKVLESLYDSRHYAQERLWSGDDLVTQEISSAINVWPQFGLAYTEKTLTVTNTSFASWPASQEAIYTFHVPEGAVVTSLSLWIGGQESKGILTTKGKADSAYKTIVGRERRDPSVVHWQEGNTVSVRVFPVDNGKSRKFKLGITAPLLKRNNKLVYENIWFDGPAATHAQEEVDLSFIQPIDHMIAPAAFESTSSRHWQSKGSYKADWKIELNEQPLSAAAFAFDGHFYKVRPYVPQPVKASFNTVYLDINKAWSQAEFEMIWDQVKGKEVYVYTDELVKLTDSNREEMFNWLQGLQFSLFPFFEIKDTASSLVISRSTMDSPNLQDLKDSRFMKQMQTYLGARPSIRLFNIGPVLSPYLRSLREYRILSYVQGPIDQVKELVTKQQWVASQENDQQVIIHDAAMAIVKTADSASVPADAHNSSVAPDHLMRLFSYNHIMQQTGSRLLTEQPEDDAVVQEAASAYVVSPVSSMVVLETQQDYDRFDIKDKSNSLHNASMHSKGAVPEPHEWVLIILAAVVVLTVIGKPMLKKQQL